MSRAQPDDEMRTRCDGCGHLFLIVNMNPMQSDDATEDDPWANMTWLCNPCLELESLFPPSSTEAGREVEST